MKRFNLFYLFVIAMMMNVACTKQADKKENTEKAVATETKTSEPILLDAVATYIDGIENEFSQIPEDRKLQLKKLALYVKTKNASNEVANLMFICTHNSRRSHMSQLWAQTAAYYYGVDNVACYSGGTESTAFNPRSVRALRKAGFNIEQQDSTANPLYLVRYAESEAPVKGFSKKYNDPFNPTNNFVAIMTCSHADKTCPQVDGASMRIAIPYVDPKVADNTPGEAAKYDERCQQIATEMFYIFSLIKTN